MKIPIDKIIVGQRQRIDIGDLSDLETMAAPKIGQVVPIIVSKVLDGYELIGGFRRLTKAKQLGWKEIEAWDKGTMTTGQKQIMEFIEDVGRKDRTWQEKAIAIRNIKAQAEHDGLGRITHRQMEQLSGLGRHSIQNYLELADYLQSVLVDKRADDEVWKSAGWTTAYKILVDRHMSEIQREQERRRQLLLEQNHGMLPLTTDQPASEYTADDAPSSSPGSDGDKTPEQAAERVKVYIYGSNDPMAPRQQDEIGTELYFATVLVNPSTQELILASNALRPVGFGAAFRAMSLHGMVRSIDLIWNKVTAVESEWPFDIRSYETIRIFGPAKTPTERSLYPPYQAVITAIPASDDDIPLTVIQHILDAFCPPNMAVLCNSSLPALAIAESGRYPIWFEPDKERFDKTCAALRAFYEQTIPNCEVLLR